MIIALDYDGTYTADPDLWLEYVKSAQKRGHNVYCITMRYTKEGFDMDPRLTELVTVIFTGRQAKKQFVETHHNMSPDVWIDDNPIWIYQPAS